MWQCTGVTCTVYSIQGMHTLVPYILHVLYYMEYILTTPLSFQHSIAIPKFLDWIWPRYTGMVGFCPAKQEMMSVPPKADTQSDWQTNIHCYIIACLKLKVIHIIPYVGFIQDTLFSWILWKLCDLWKFNLWTAISLVKCIISYWNKEGSSWNFKRELSVCNWFVKIGHDEKYRANRTGKSILLYIKLLYVSLPGRIRSQLIQYSCLWIVFPTDMRPHA